MNALAAALDTKPHVSDTVKTAIESAGKALVSALPDPMRQQPIPPIGPIPSAVADAAPIQRAPLSAPGGRRILLARAADGAGAIAVQLALPERLTVGPRLAVPALEGALLLGLSLATPRELEQRAHGAAGAPRSRLTALVSAANVFSLGALTHLLLHHEVSNGQELIGSGVLIWLTNFLIFALWYWELDRGGPGVARPQGTTAHPTSCSRR